MTNTADDRLTRCERAGNIVTFVAPSASERDALLVHYAALRAAGHAVVCDEIQHQDAPTELRVHHYLICKKCGEV